MVDENNPDYATSDSIPLSYNEFHQRIGARGYIQNETYTGDGIRIGIYEIGQCKQDDETLAEYNVTYRDVTSIGADHASDVLRVMGSIAPEAHFFSCGDMDRGSTGLSWLIEQQCDIINCSRPVKTLSSYGSAVESCMYRYDIDGMFDYIAAVYFITFVKAAGNINIANDGRITSPGYAHNVITVGGVMKVRNDDNRYSIVHHPDACYITEADSLYPKPTVSAFHHIEQKPDQSSAHKSGTSYATPQVTGCIALFMEARPMTIVFPEKIMATVIASAQKTDDYTNSNSIYGGFDNQVGAGVINLSRMLNSSYYSAVNAGVPYGGIVAETTVYVHSGATIQAGLASLAIPVSTSSTGGLGDMTTVYYTNYAIQIYDPTGQYIIWTSLANSVVELARYEATITGNYRICISQFSEQSDQVGEEYCYLVYNAW